MSLRSDWNAAKKVAEQNFKQAYEAWRKKLEKDAKAGDRKAKDKIVLEGLASAGLDKGFKFTNYMSFSGGLGPTLDKIEKTHASVTSKFDALTLNDCLKKKGLRAIFRHYANNAGYMGEALDFVLLAGKMKPQDVYTTFILPGSKKQINIPSSEVAKWRKCEEEGNWKPAKALVKDSQTKMLSLIGPHVDLIRQKDDYSRLLRGELGGKDMPKLIAKARKTAFDYAREVQKYGKRWKAMKPDFWTPLNKQLNTIFQRLDEIEKLYPK